MSDPVALRGYRFSVYTRIAAMVLREKGVAYRREEVDPFAPDLPPAYRALHPFARVPVLSHGDFEVYETAAIARYVDAAFAGPNLTPRDPRAQARMAQVVSIVDAYGYGPMVRQVFAHGVFRPCNGEPWDAAEIERGLETSRTVLAALDAIAAEGRVLDGARLTLADCHLAPMVAYFVQVPEGADRLSRHPALSPWWQAVKGRRSLAETDPGPPVQGD